VVTAARLNRSENLQYYAVNLCLVAGGVPSLITSLTATFYNCLNINRVDSLLLTIYFRLKDPSAAILPVEKRSVVPGGGAATCVTRGTAASLR